MSNQLRTQFGLHLGGTFSTEGATKTPPTRENHLKEKWEGKNANSQSTFNSTHLGV